MHLPWLVGAPMTLTWSMEHLGTAPPCLTTPGPPSRLPEATGRLCASRMCLLILADRTMRGIRAMPGGLRKPVAATDLTANGPSEASPVLPCRERPPQDAIA